jgi:hypothetical protein
LLLVILRGLRTSAKPDSFILIPANKLTPTTMDTLPGFSDLPPPESHEPKTGTKADDNTTNDEDSVFFNEKTHYNHNGSADYKGKAAPIPNFPLSHL